MFTLLFWKAVAERSIKTFCQVLAVLITVNGLGIHEVDWFDVLSIAGLAAIASLVTSVATAGATDGSPSLTTAETLKKG